MSDTTGAGDAYNAAVHTTRNPHAEKHADARGKAYPVAVSTSPPSTADLNS